MVVIMDAIILLVAWSCELWYDCVMNKLIVHPKWFDRIIPVTSAPSLELSDLWIRTKDARRIPFVPNPVQSAYMSHIGWDEMGLSSLRGRRDMVLKARQQGFSTMILAFAYLYCATQPNTYGMIVAHEAEATKRLFDIIKRYHDNLPSELRPETKYNTRTELYFKGLDSTLTVATAGSDNIGHGATLQFLHMSEWSRWPSLEPMVGLMEALSPHGYGVIESTANGINHMYDEWQAIKRGESKWCGYFSPWFAHPDYRSDASDFVPDAEEERLAADFGLTLGQLAWRRDKIWEMRQQGGSERFMEQYPATDAEAFISSAESHVYPVEYLREILGSALSCKPIITFKPGDVLSGTMDVWEEPQDGELYVIGADVAEGRASDGGSHDYSTFEVFNVRTGAQAASYYGRPDTDAYGNDIALVSGEYNDAIVRIERNGPGLAVINVLSKLGVRMYQHRVASRGYTPLEQTVDGWPATRQTKDVRDACLQSALQDAAAGIGDIQLRSPRCIEQLMRYVHLGSGRKGGENGAHDDHNTSVGLAWAERMDQLPNLRSKRVGHHVKRRKISGRIVKRS